MGAFDNMGGNPPVSGEEFDSIDPNSKFANYDSSKLEAIGGQENAPPPDGAASRGALGNPATAGETPPEAGAIDEEPAQDTLSIFQQASPESKDFTVDKVTESYAPFGYSLEGAMDNALMKGGPQALARAAQFGIDLMPFANKINPDGSYSKKDPEDPRLQQSDPGLQQSGQAFGAVPTDEQAASGGPFKDQAAATEDFKGAIADTEEDIKIKKHEQRQAIAAFLIEAGLRTIASARDDAAGAMAEGALGTMTAGKARKRQAEQDDIATQQRERTNRRQDEQDEAGKLEAQRKEQDRQYDISQRGAKEEEAELDKLEKIVLDDGTILYAKPSEGVLVDEGGEPYQTMTEAEKRRFSREGIDSTAHNNAVRTNMRSIQKVVDEGSYFGEDPEMKAVIEAKGDEQRELILALASKRAALEEEEETTDFVDWE